MNGQSGGFQAGAGELRPALEAGRKTMITADCEARFTIHSSIDAVAAHVLRMAD
jgi:hypothetical protein